MVDGDVAPGTSKEELTGLLHRRRGEDGDECAGYKMRTELLDRVQRADIAFLTRKSILE